MPDFTVHAHVRSAWKVAWLPLHRYVRDWSIPCPFMLGPLHQTNQMSYDDMIDWLTLALETMKAELEDSPDRFRLAVEGHRYWIAIIGGLALLDLCINVAPR